MKRLKIPRLFTPKKMLAATARRASAASAGMDFEGIPEPNMKLSRALLIVLLLHVVAVAGIIAFNAIKTRERAFVPPTSTETENKPADTAGTANHADTANTRVAASPQKQTDRQHDPKPPPAPAKDQQAKTPSSSGKTYIVKKGDNPVAIAKTLKVSYNDLIALNHVDPRKLQIGQKLLIPQTTNSKITSAKPTSQKQSKK